MAAATPRSTEPPEAAGPDAAPPLLRFDITERVLHWTTAALFAVCTATAAALYLPSLAALVGRRELVENVHVLAGLALPVPYLVARLGPWSAHFRRDIDRLARFDGEDRRWLRSLGRDPFVRSGKFNAGQKLNAAFVAGSILLFVATGSILRWFSPFPLAWRTGATFVHDWLAFFFVAVIAVHVAKGLGDREALSAMVRGPVGRRWAAKKAPRWLAEEAGE